MSNGYHKKAGVEERKTYESGRAIWGSNVDNGAFLLGKGRACTTWSANGWNIRRTTRLIGLCRLAAPSPAMIRTTRLDSEVDILNRLGRRLASAVAFSLPLGEADGLEVDGELEYEQSDELPAVSEETLYLAAGMLIDEDMLGDEAEAVQTSPWQRQGRWRR